MTSPSQTIDPISVKLLTVRGTHDARKPVINFFILFFIYSRDIDLANPASKTPRSLPPPLPIGRLAPPPPLPHTFLLSLPPPPQLVLVEEGDRVLLGRKKRGFGEGYYNGFGGKVESGETITEG
jgi:hypothetical protein